MKLVRYGMPGEEKPGMIDAKGQLRDLSAHVGDITPATVALERLATLKAMDPEALPVVTGTHRFGSCLSHVPNFYCVGLNYARHAAESGMAEPKEPILFSKATSALSGPNDDVIIPKGSEKSDWEVELGVVIGAVTEHVTVDEALSKVAGYCVINDLSERAFQLERGGQWIKGKSAPTFGPVGPWLVTADEIADPQALRLSLKLNGTTVQDSSTSDMIFSVAELIAHLSQDTTLLPGTVILTGTPSGVGWAREPKQLLRPDGLAEVEIEGIGLLRNPIVAAD